MSADLAFPILPHLEPEDLAALEAIAARRTLRSGEALYRQGDDTASVLFLLTGLMRATASLPDGQGVLAGLIGPGGAVGLAPAMASLPTNHAATALGEVVGLAIDGPHLRRLAAERPNLGLALSSLLAGEMAQAHDELACCAHHRIEARLARLLLRLNDRLGGVELHITQDDLAQMLAVQRTTVTTLAHRLKDEGLIGYRRGRLRILDREGLERLACGCPLSAVRG